LLMLAGHVDLDELDRWIRVGPWNQVGCAIRVPIDCRASAARNDNQEGAAIPQLGHRRNPQS
jgi:hypothetical protein